MAKLMSPNTTIWWVPVAGITNPAAPTVAQITAGTNISGAIVTGYTLGATDSDTDDSKTIVDESNVSTRTFGNYEGSLSFFRDPVGATATIFTTARDLFKTPRVEGWLVSRHGKKSTAAVVAGDLVSVFKFISDAPQNVEGDGGSPIQFTVPFRPQGVFHVNVAVAA